MDAFAAGSVSGIAVERFEKMLRTAIFKPMAEFFGQALQEAAERHDEAYRPRPGEKRKGCPELEVCCIFGAFTLRRDYYHHAGHKHGHCPADAALGLEGSLTPALARLVCLEGADEPSYQKAGEHLLEVGGIRFEARRIQRVVQDIGKDAAA